MSRYERPPGPPWKLMGEARPYLANRADFLLDTAQRYGRVSFFRLGFYRVYLVTSPEAVRTVLTERSAEKSWVTRMLLRPVLGNGLLTAEGDFYKQQRRIVQPAFVKAKIDSYAPLAVAAAQELSQRWSETTVDVAEEMMELTLQMAGRSLFGEEMSDKSGPIREALNSFYGMVDRIVGWGLLAFLLPTPTNLRFFYNIYSLNRLIDEVIARRESSATQKEADFLDNLLMGHGRNARRQVRYEALTLLLAGHETTAVALTWAWYLLSQYPESRARLQRELDQVLGGREPTLDDLDELVYTRRVLMETMRLYPPAYLLDRVCPAPLEVDGYTIPANDFIFVSPYVCHRNPEFFPDPERFDPDRFSDEAIAARPRFTYLPFGVGPRACIGQGFAWMSATLMLATLAQRWSLHLQQGHPVDTDPKITLRPRYGMKMLLQAR